MAQGNKYGMHRVLEPQGVMPQTAVKIDNNMEIYDNEILIDVIALNIDSASFTQIEEASDHDTKRIGEMIQDIVAKSGKMQNPVTGSGGMLIGIVEKIGKDLDIDLKVGDRIATLVSLSLTPLRIDEITHIEPDIDRVMIKGKAILFESGIYAKLPDDLPESLALAALDIAGAPAQTAKLVKPGDSVLVIGAAGKSGLMCCYEAKKRVGPTGRVVGLDYGDAAKARLEEYGFCHEVISADATKPMEVLEKTLAANGGKEFDVSINVVNVQNTEMSSIVPVKDEGIVYFFSMATSFTKAALGAEGIGKDVTMIIGNGYTKGHAEITLEEIRESDTMRKIFEGTYK
ncbi:MAG: L-erythro-3,5-diaminohexanoate dehydrogenase [Clostridium sp.]|jgi:L-erythro-3,5-diaminohexanoate dehydrogenase|nr:L-erythro-3,5-diaminohexanoate dehydrogenase [Clostridium sp.]